jgi:DNA-binding transcriptional MocR family regulator
MEDERHVIIEDEALAAGFTQIPNLVLRRPDLSPGAKLTYMVLLSYAWQKESCYPGQDRLAEDMGVSERSIVTYLQHLARSGLVTVRRRGLGLTNVYVLHRISGSANFADQAGSAKFALPEVQNSTPPEVQNLQPKNTQRKDSDEQDEDLSNNSKGPSRVSASTREMIGWYVQDLARELNDQAPLRSTTTRVVRLYERSELDLEVFLDQLQAARARTQRYSGRITAAGENGRKTKTAYFLAVLEDLLGIER